MPLLGFAFFNLQRHDLLYKYSNDLIFKFLKCDYENVKYNDMFEV